MPILHIEHAITDLDTWLRAFKRFAPARDQAGVIGTQVLHPSDNVNYLVVNLEFETVDSAARFQTFLRQFVWSTPNASPALVGDPKAVILTEIAVDHAPPGQPATTPLAT